MAPLGSTGTHAEYVAADRVKRLADEFGVTPTAIRVRLEQMKLLR